jgi:integrase
MIDQPPTSTGDKPPDQADANVRDGEVDAASDTYASDWADFAGWCTRVGQRALPATVATVASYLHDFRGDQAVAERHLLAIAYTHRAAGHAPPPRRSRQVLAALGELPPATPGPRRPNRRHPVTPLTGELLAAALATCKPATPQGQRDRALLTLGHTAGWRRGQLVDLDWEDLEERGGVLRIVARPGRPGLELGHAAHRPGGADPARARCPVCAVAGWRAVAAAALDVDAERLRGPVFGPVNRHGQLRAAIAGGRPVAVRLDPGAVSLIVKAHAWAALERRRPQPGSDELERTVAGFSGDSLRVGWQVERPRAPRGAPPTKR